jgi:hypothetical protein
MALTTTILPRLESRRARRREGIIMATHIAP